MRAQATLPGEHHRAMAVLLAARIAAQLGKLDHVVRGQPPPTVTESFIERLREVELSLRRARARLLADQHTTPLGAK